MEEKNYERTRNVLTKGVREWVNDEFITNPHRSWDSIQKTAYAIWQRLELDSALNQKPNGEPIFYLNADDPNKLLEIGPNKTVGSVAVSLEGQIIAACRRANIKFEEVPTKTSRHSHKPSENVWYKVEFESALDHIDYMWFTKYTDEGCPEKGKPFFRNAKGNLSNWPRGLTSLMKENEEAKKSKKAEKEKEKRDKKKEIEEWINGCGDGTGTKEGFILCQKHSQLVEEIKAQNPKRVRLKDWGFIERTVKNQLHTEEVQEPVLEVKQATRDDILGAELSPTEVLEKMFKKEIADGREITITGFRRTKSENHFCYLQFEVDGHPLQRSTRTKDKRRAQAILKEGKKMFSPQEPEVKPEPMEAMETVETMKTTEQESSAWSWLGGLFGKSEQVKVIDEPNEELEEVLEASVKDINNKLMKAKEMVKELEAKMDEAKKSEAEEEREALLARIAELDKRISNGRT